MNVTIAQLIKCIHNDDNIDSADNIDIKENIDSVNPIHIAIWLNLYYNPMEHKHKDPKFWFLRVFNYH
jgi:hypothetical protein